MMQLVGGLIIFVGLYVVKKGGIKKASSQFEKGKLTVKRISSYRRRSFFVS